MTFPLRTAREYPITGSHLDPELAQRRPARSVTVIWMSLLAIACLLCWDVSAGRSYGSAERCRAAPASALRSDFRRTWASRLLAASRLMKVAEAERDFEPPAEAAQ